MPLGEVAFPFCPLWGRWGRELAFDKGAAGSAGPGYEPSQLVDPVSIS